MTKDDNDIWQAVKNSIKPFKKQNKYVEKTPVPSSKKQLQPKPQTGSIFTKFMGAHAKSESVINSKSTIVDLKEKTVGDISGLNKSHAKKLTSGLVKINATLDLHGLTKDTAHTQVVNFVKNSVANNHKNIKIITGKGSGILQAEVPKWLNGADLSPHILSVVHTPQRQGGTGALIVALKSKK